MKEAEISLKSTQKHERRPLLQWNEAGI